LTKIEKLIKDSSQGNLEAQFNLGHCYYNGDGVRQDFVEAVKWYTKAAEQGHAKSQYSLGYCYAKGEGVKQDYTQTMKWWTKAAEQGHAKAQHNLACCYDEGMGVTQDFVEAVKWYAKAAEQGLDNAQFNLGLCYGKGYGVTQDSGQAEIWLRKAAEQGHLPAQEMLQRLGYESRANDISVTATEKVYSVASETKYTEESTQEEKRAGHKKMRTVALFIQIGIIIPWLIAVGSYADFGLMSFIIFAGVPLVSFGLIFLLGRDSKLSYLGLIATIIVSLFVLIVMDSENLPSIMVMLHYAYGLGNIAASVMAFVFAKK